MTTPRDLAAEAAQLTPEDHAAALVRAAIAAYGAEAVAAHQAQFLEAEGQNLADADRDLAAAEELGDEEQADRARHIRDGHSRTLAEGWRWRDTARPFLRRTRVPEAKPAARLRSATPRPRQRREQHVARSTSSCDGGDDSDPEPEPSDPEQAGRRCAAPGCSSEITGRQQMCSRCKGRLKKQRQRERRKVALLVADELDAEARLRRLSGARNEILLRAVERHYLEFTFFKDLMEGNGDRVVRRPLPHAWVGEDGRARRERVAA